MKSEEIRELFAQFEPAASELENVECWSARELQVLIGYTKWENFEKVIQKAKDACKSEGEEEAYHFPDVRKMIALGKGAEKEMKNTHVELTSFCEEIKIDTSFWKNPNFRFFCLDLKA